MVFCSEIITPDKQSKQKTVNLPRLLVHQKKNHPMFQHKV